MTYPRRLNALALLCVLLLIPTISVADDFRGAGSHSNVSSLFQPDEYIQHLGVLASNEFEGRAPGQPGIDTAADYIASVFEEMGVRPAGDDGTYFQKFPLKVNKRLGDRTRLSIGTKNTTGRDRLRVREDYIPLPFSDEGRFKGDVIFVGYGIVDSDIGYDEYAGVDVEGKVVLMIRRTPDFDDFSQRHAMFASKARRAIEHKAAALLIVNPIGDEDGDKLYEFNANANGVFSLASRSYGIPMIHIRQAVADKMLKDAGLGGLEAVQDRIEEGHKPISQPLDGVNVRGRADVKTVESVVKNIVGLIPGSGPQADEYIILGAHYDHHGIRHQDRPDFSVDKDIYNGADDNASGVAMLMTFAKAYTEGPKPNRSIILIAFTAEELGLIGSRYFAEHPTIDLDDCVAMFNFDMVGRLRNDRLEIAGLRTGDYEATIRNLAERYHIDVQDGGGGQGPSDHTWFYRAGIPVTFWHTGLHKEYTQPQDDTELINEEGAMVVARLAADVIDEIDAKAEPPVFEKDRPRFASRDEDDDHADAPPRDGVRLGITVESNGADGVVVLNVVDNSAANRAGILANDRILQIGDSPIADVDGLIKAMATVKPGDARDVKVRRDDKELVLQAQFGAPKVAAAPADGETYASTDDTLTRLIALVRKNIGNPDKTAESRTVTTSISRGPMSIKVSSNDPETSKMLMELAQEFAEGLGPDTTFSISMEVAVPGDGGEGTVKTSYSISLKRTGGDEPPPEKAADKAPDKSGRPTRKGFSDSDEMPSRPPVRIGIMPTHGEQDGEGFGIAGVMEGGPAYKAGMQDSDRILTIGGKKISDIYSYMDALRDYTPGDAIEVVVLRDGEHVPLTIKVTKQKKRDRQSAD